MTCIAVRNRVMAADTQMTIGDEKLRVKKLRVLEDGSIFGSAGDASAIDKLEEWVKAGAPKNKRPRINKELAIECLVLKPDGTIWFIGTDLVFEQLAAEFMAIGTGGAYALGAMARGATAVQAVKIAARFDVNTSEPIDKMELKQ